MHWRINGELRRIVYTDCGISRAKQVAAATKWRREEHERLIAEGWLWDGADGYTAPPETPPKE